MEQNWCNLTIHHHPTPTRQKSQSTTVSGQQWNRCRGPNAQGQQLLQSLSCCPFPLCPSHSRVPSVAPCKVEDVHTIRSSLLITAIDSTFALEVSNVNIAARKRTSNQDTPGEMDEEADLALLVCTCGPRYRDDARLGLALILPRTSTCSRQTC